MEGTRNGAFFFLPPEPCAVSCRAGDDITGQGITGLPVRGLNAADVICFYLT